MRDQVEHPKLVEAIDLATIADFELGLLRIRPSLRRIGVGAQEESVEPRVMQALIALAEAGEAVVSRDALIDRCWGGRIVGEDAINRCIAKVRRLAETTQPPAFIIETVSKVGYRLKLRDGPCHIADATQPAPAPQPIPNRFGARAASLAAGLLALVACVAVLAWPPASREKPAAAVLADPINPPPHTLAVLAFANLSGDPSQEYLSDGMSEAVIDVLSRVNQLHVTARTSSFTFKGRAATIEDIARKLNVGAVLEGSLRRQGTHLRIDAHLSDARTGYPLWSQSFDADQADMLKLQDDIAGAVADALQVKLVDTDSAGRSLGGTTNPLAFDAYLRGEKHLQALGPEDEAALAEFRKAVALDRNFALAQSSLAFALVLVSELIPPGARTAAMLAEARAAAERAVASAPGLGLPHAELAMILRNGVTDLGAAWAEAVRARSLTPGAAGVEEIVALIARAVGRGHDAVEAATRAVELDPLRVTSRWVLAWALACAGRLDAAQDAFQHLIALAGKPPEGVSYELGSLLLRQGKPAAARQTCQAVATWVDLLCLAIADHALGRQTDADADLKRLQAIMGDGGAYNFSEIYAQWHDPAHAMQWLAKARTLNDAGLMDIAWDPWLDPIRGQPGFREIEQTLHLPPPD